jgi:hypothetical protein
MLNYYSNRSQTSYYYSSTAQLSGTPATPDEFYAWLAQKTLDRQIRAYQDLLRETDYIPLKIIEGVATAEDYAEDLAQRQQWREKVRELEQQLTAESATATTE